MVSEAIINPIRLPSIKRYKELFLQKKRMSILRNLQYEILKGTRLKGKVLDFGGGKKADYHYVIQCETYDSVNIDQAMDPSWVVKTGDAIPCPDNCYDTVISMNTIEHIYDAHSVIQEMHRVLKKKGDFICALPFLYPIHAHPDDYFRPTASWWKKTLTEKGFENIKISPLLWGPFTTGLTCSGIPGPFKRLRFHMALILDILYAKMRFGKAGYYNEETGKFALGYFIQAGKV